MIKIVISTATTLLAAALLVACNGSGTNSSDVTSGNAAPVAIATCASSNNWQSVGMGMSASQVEARLGKPRQITSTKTETAYIYEACRGFKITVKDAVAATTTTPAVPPEYGTTLTGGIVTINNATGVSSVKSPERIEEKVVCEWDFYNYPYAAGQTNRVCRESNNQF
jgi:hypothetical protein